MQTDTRRHWARSTYSGSWSNCVEVARGKHGMIVRDSKDPAGPVLTFAAAQWSAFTTGVRVGQFE